jgi:hypothetical protein
MVIEFTLAETAEATLLVARNSNGGFMLRAHQSVSGNDCSETPRINRKGVPDVEVVAAAERAVIASSPWPLTAYAIQ